MPDWTAQIREDLARHDLPVVHLSCADWEEEQAETRPYLTEEEQLRADRYRHARDRLSFCAGRWLIRQVLGHWTGGADGVALEQQDKGRPYSPHPETPSFSLSHAGGWVALALSGREEVGVDLEDTTRPLRSPDRLARRYFADREIGALEGDPFGEFFRIWTRREARVKAVGLGIASGFAGLDTLEEEQQGDWGYGEWKLEGGIQGALAHTPTAGRIRLYRLFPSDQRLQSL